MIPATEDRTTDEYAGSHEYPTNRALRAVGIPVIACGVIAAVLGPRVVGVSQRTAVAGGAAGWGLLFVGHAIEKNRPAILARPGAAFDAILWWGRGAARACRHMLAGERPSL